MLEEFAKLQTSHDEEQQDLPISRVNLVAKNRVVTKKVELPLFDRSGPIGWITRAYTYFEV